MVSLIDWYNLGTGNEGGYVKIPDYWHVHNEEDKSFLFVEDIDEEVYIAGLFLNNRRLQSPLEKRWNNAQWFFLTKDDHEWEEAFLPFFRG